PTRGGRDNLAPPPPPNPQGGKVKRKAELDLSDADRSPTGVSVDRTRVTLTGDSALSMPVAWVVKSFNISATDSFDVLEFRNRFLGGGQGWLTVFVDSELVSHRDERYAQGGAGVPDSEIVLLPQALEPGTHTVGFRLDPY